MTTLNEIDRSSPVPIYYQLQTILRRQIEEGVLQPGDQLPTELELCSRYGISRSPVRQALSELAYEGLITRRPAVGTFVAQRLPHKQHPEITLHIVGTDMRWMAALRRAATVWNEEHPAQPVHLETKMIPRNKLHEYIGVAVGEGTAPDIGMLDCVWIPEFAKKGYLIPLGELDGEWTRSQYAPNLYPAARQANSFGTQLFGLQFEADVSLLWYRKDWFTAEGLKAPTNWEELTAVARYFKQPEVVARYATSSYPLVFPGGLPGAEATVYNLLPLVWSAGGDVIQDRCVALDSPATHRALTFLRQLLHDGLIPPTVVEYTWDRVPQLFARGQFAIALGGSYEVGVITETADWDQEEFNARIGLAPTPGPIDHAPSVTMGGMSCAIFRQTGYPKVAMGLLKTAMRHDLILQFSRLTLQQTPRPSLSRHFSATEEPFLYHTAHLLQAARARPPLPEYEKISRQLQRMFEETFTTDIPIPELVARTARYIGVLGEIPPCETSQKEVMPSVTS